MNIEILEESKTKIVFKTTGEDHTILNILQKELWNDNAVKIAAYRMDHPLIGTPEITVEVTQGNSPKKAIIDAIKRVTKKLEKTKQDLIEAL